MEEKIENQKDNKKGLKDLQDSLLTEHTSMQRRNIFSTARFMDPSPNTSNKDMSYSHLKGHHNSTILISKIIEWSAIPAQPENLTSFLSHLNSTDILEKHYAIICLRRILSVKTKLPIREVLDHKNFIEIVKMTQEESEPHLQLEAAWCLANLASGNKEETRSLIKKNIIGIFKQLSQHSMVQIAEQALWGLGNISGDGPELRNILLKSDCMPQLISLFDSKPVHKLKNMLLWIFSNICRMKPDNETISEMTRELTKRLVQGYIETDEMDVEEDCLLGLAKCSKKHCLHILCNSHFLNKLNQKYRSLFFSVEENQSKISAINSIIGGLTSGNDEQTKAVVQAGFLTSLTELLSTRIEDILKEICWVLSNIAIGEIDMIFQFVNEPGLFPKIVQIIHNGESDISKEALWIVCNLTLTKDDSFIQILIEREHILDLFREILSQKTDVRKINLVLEGIKELLQYFDSKKQNNLNSLSNLMIENGISKLLEDLQYHHNNHVYYRSLRILEKFFPLESEV